MYKELTKKDIDALEREKIDESNKIGGIRKSNILNILDKVGSIFTCAYLHYKNVPKDSNWSVLQTENSTKMSLINDLSKRLLGLEFKSNHSKKSKCLK